MRYFLDTEFSERGHRYPVELISIGIVADDGREFYAVALDGWREDLCNDWVKANVLPNLADPRSGNTWRVLRVDIQRQLLAFVNQTQEKPAFWGYFADYDWVVFCQIFGAMIDLPKGWPMYCNDVKQLCKSLGNPELPRQAVDNHNALEDARHIRTMYNFLKDSTPKWDDRAPK